MPAYARTPAEAEIESLGQAIMALRPEELAEWITTLDEHELAAVEIAQSRVTASGWRSDPAAMAAHLTLGRFKQWAYVKLLSQQFAKLVSGEQKRQIWTLPTRYGKSTLGSQWGPVWTFDQHPEANLILVSYGDNLAMENATACRDLMREHGTVLRTTLRKDRQKADRFKTEHGGGLLAAGIDSAIMGFGAGKHGGVVVDDPMKNWQEAMSKARREHVHNQHKAVLRSRLDDETAWMLVIMQRLHQEDLAGKLYDMKLLDGTALREDLEDDEQEEWQLIRLPEIAEVFDPQSHDPYLRMPDPLGRQPGEPLEPEKFTIREVRKKARDQGSYIAAAMQQQRPAPEEGGELKRAWWRWTDALPAKFDDAASSWDMKLKDNESGDFVVGQAWGRTGGDYWMIEQLRGQFNLATTKIAIALMQVRHPELKRHFIENSGNGPDLKKQLSKPAPKYELRKEEARGLGMNETEREAVQRVIRRGMNRLILVPPIGSKPVRARAVSGILESGNVWLRLNDPQAVALVNEAAEFPNGTHDDQVDAWSQAMSKLDVRADAEVKQSKTVTPQPTPGQPPTPVKRAAKQTAVIRRAGGNAAISTASQSRRRRLPTAR